MTCYKNSRSNYEEFNRFVNTHRYTWLGSGLSLITQQTGNCDGSMYMFTEVIGLNEKQLHDFQYHFGNRVSILNQRQGRFSIRVSHTD